jgi:hypothetical protein
MAVRILQYNVWKSDKVMAPLLADPKTAEIDIIAIQEPYRRKDMIATHCPQSCDFWPAYPEKEHASVCFLVNKKVPSHCWNVEFITKNLAVLHSTRRLKTQCDKHLLSTTGKLQSHE